MACGCSQPAPPAAVSAARPAPQEAHTLLSAAAVALSHARCAWPLLVPVHDAVREGYRGVAVLPSGPASGATIQFDTDSLHSSRLPEGLLRLDQHLALFARQLAAAGAPAAAAACRAAAGAEVQPAPASMAADAASCGGSGDEAAGPLQVAVAVRHCYALPDADEDGEAWLPCAVQAPGCAACMRHG